MDLHPGPMTSPVASGESLTGCSTPSDQLSNCSTRAGGTGPSSTGTDPDRQVGEGISRGRVSTP